MSKLERMIEELCPDGVEYKPLGDFATITRGGNFQKKDFAEKGIPCIHYGQIYTRYGLFADRTFTRINKEAASKSKFASQNDIVMAVTSENVEDVCKSVAWLGSDDIAVSGHTAIIRHNQNSKYLSYYFHSSMFFAQKVKLAHGTKVIEVTPSKLSLIPIPIPPLPIQQEIVRILDAFTSLETELEVELEARKKQYEYYRDDLLRFGDEVPIVSIGSICDIITGGEAPEKCIKGAVGNEDYPYPIWANGKQVYGFTNTYIIDKDAVVISSIGANTGAVFYRRAYFTPIIRLKVIIPKIDYINARYLFYAVSTAEIISKSGSVPNMNAADIKKIVVPIPSLEEQERIVTIIDHFDALCNDLTIGLPAEIEARRKQYEYYRDKLLAFAEISA